MNLNLSGALVRGKKEDDTTTTTTTTTATTTTTPDRKTNLEKNERQSMLHFPLHSASSLFNNKLLFRLKTKDINTNKLCRSYVSLSEAFNFTNIS